MKVKPEDIVRRYHAAADQWRLILLCGPNVTRCQALVDELVQPLAKSAERVDMTIADVSEGPARLNDGICHRPRHGRQDSLGEIDNRRAGCNDRDLL